MSEVIIEEVDKNDLTEAELQEFITTDGIPIVEQFGSDESVSENDMDSSEGDEKVPSTSSAPIPTKTKKRSRRKKQPAQSPEKSQSIFFKKFAAGEITFTDYAKRVGEISLDEEPEDESDEDESTTTLQRIKKRSKEMTEKAETHHTKKTKRSLPPALQGLMGEANLCFVRGDAAMAEKLCLEVIRNEPMAADPYVTLSQIYENTDDEKYKVLLLIAAHVNSTAHQWLQAADVFLDKRNLRQASFCYAKATRCDPKNLEIRLKRIEILKELGDEKHVLHCTYCMLGFIPKDDHEFLISQAKWVAKKFFDEGLITKSLDAMFKAYNKVPEHFKAEDVNAFIQLLMNNKNYKKCLSVLTCHTGMKFNVREIKGPKSTSYEIKDLTIPEDMLMDLRTKMCICLIQLDTFNLLDELIDNIETYINVETGGDCYLDIAEALIPKGKHKEALRLLNPLVHSRDYSLAAVWLTHAECLRAIHDYKNAIESYKKVVEMARHIDARLTLAALLKLENRIEESIEALTQNPDTEVLSTEMLKEKCLLLKELGRVDEYLSDGYTLLRRHCMDYRSRQEVQIVSSFTRTCDRINEIKNLRKNRDEEVEDDNAPEFCKSYEPTISDDWNMFSDLIKTAWENKRYTMMQRLSFAGMSSRRLQQHVKEIDFIGAVACLFNKEPLFGYNKIREFLNSDKDKNRYWNFFNLMIYITQDTRYNRFVQRLFDKQTNFTANVPPLVYTLIANYALCSNSFKYAIHHYDQIYRRYPSPMIAMILGILYSQISNQKYINRKQSLVIQAMNYFEQYQKSREEEAKAEVLYNTGRFYHQIGILSTAKHYYEEALKVTNPLIESDPQILDLRQTIAFNLHTIYRHSGNRHMARKILYDHIVV